MGPPPGLALPQRLWKDQPARVGDDDERLGPSSLQRFQGEDLEVAARKAALAMRLREDLDKQIEEKKARPAALGAAAAR